MVESGYALTHVDDVPVTHMADIEDMPKKFHPLDVRNVDEVLETEKMKVKMWYIPSGSVMGAHGHSQQEELYYVLQGTFSLRIGPPDNIETVEVKTGAFFAASPEVVRGYENVGEEEGRVLVVSSPNVDEPGIPEPEMVD